MGPHRGQQGVQVFERTDLRKWTLFGVNRSVNSHGWCVVLQSLLWCIGHNPQGSGLPQVVLAVFSGAPSSAGSIR